MKSNLILTVTLLFFALQQSISQSITNPAGTTSIRDLLDPGYQNNEVLANNTLNGIEGDPFLSEWKEGEVITTSGTKFKNISIRYNVYTDEVLVKSEENEPMVLFDKLIDKFVIQNQTFIRLPQIGFAKELFSEADKNLFLCKKYTKKIKSAAPANGYNSGELKDQLIDNDYLAVSINSEIQILPKRKKVIIELFSQYYPDFESVLKNNNLNPKKESDLVKALTILN